MHIALLWRLRIQCLGIFLFAMFLSVEATMAEGDARTPTPVEIPRGDVTDHTFSGSKIFPGTVRSYQVYVPKQYDPSKPACLYVGQDGPLFDEAAVFDQLIYEKAMPVTVGVFVTPGRVPTVANLAGGRNNRSFEYDTLSDDYVRFLEDELLPHIVKEQNLNLSTNGNDRAISGSSSGGICAFTAAWERPDAFRRVFSCCGSYTSFRGGHDYPTLIRLFEPKPIRVFLVDGRADLNISNGNWWLANQEMESALKFAGYEVEAVWGDGGHGNAEGVKAFSMGMRWLWKDWPAPVKAGVGGGTQGILIPDEPWKLVGQGYQCSGGLTANAKGEVFFNDNPVGKTYKIGLDGTVSLFATDSKSCSGLAFCPDGRLYVLADGSEKIMAYDAEGRASTVVSGIHGHGLAVGRDGSVYVTSPGTTDAEGSTVWFISRTGEKKVVDTGLKNATGVAFSLDQSFLFVADGRSHWVYSYLIQPDGSLTHKQRFHYLQVPDIADDSGADGLCVGSDGQTYIATRMGIQACTWLAVEGTVTCIIPTPNGTVSSICFGGPTFDTLFATCGDKVFQRKVKVRGYVLKGPSS